MANGTGHGRCCAAGMTAAATLWVVLFVVPYQDDHNGKLGGRIKSKPPKRSAKASASPGDAPAPGPAEKKFRKVDTVMGRLKVFGDVQCMGIENLPLTDENAMDYAETERNVDDITREFGARAKAENNGPNVTEKFVVPGCESPPKSSIIPSSLSSTTLSDFNPEHPIDEDKYIKAHHSSTDVYNSWIDEPVMPHDRPNVDSNDVTSSGRSLDNLTFDQLIEDVREAYRTDPKEANLLRQMEDSIVGNMNDSDYDPDNELEPGDGKASVTEEGVLDLSRVKKRVRTLTLCDMNISVIPDNAFDRFPRLSFLQLKNNNIKTLPKGLFKRNPLIQYVDLSNNRLATPPGGVFANIHSLLSLNLARNRIEHIRGNTFHNLTQLRELFLEQNHLRSLPKQPFHTTMPRLEDLLLNSNQLRDLPPGTFANMSCLFKLEILNNTIAHIPEKAFVGCSKLTILNMEHNKLTSLGEATLWPLRNTLRQLYFGGNLLPRVPEKLLRGLTGLITLSMGDNPLKVLPEEFLKDQASLLTLKMPNTNVTRLARRHFDKCLRLSRLEMDGTPIREMEHGTLFQLSDLLVANFKGHEMRHVSRDTFCRNRRLRELHLRGKYIDSIPLGTTSYCAGSLRFVDVPNEPISFGGDLAPYLHPQQSRIARGRPFVRRGSTWARAARSPRGGDGGGRGRFLLGAGRSSSRR